VLVLTLLTYSHHKAYQAGRAMEQAAFLNRINQENEHAGNEAERWRADYRRCVNAGGLYQFDTSTCQH
jgi:hypothetical protein